MYNTEAVFTDLLAETCAAGQLRRLECSWAIEQSIIGTYQVQNEFGAAGDRISQLQQQIRQDGLGIIQCCDSDDELDFLFPEITRIHNHDLAALDIWLNQIEWTKALPESEFKQLQSADFSKSNLAVIGDKNSATTALAIPDEQLFYENLRPKSHFYALRTQLELMLDRQRREDYERDHSWPLFRTLSIEVERERSEFHAEGWLLVLRDIRFKIEQPVLNGTGNCKGL